METLKLGQVWREYSEKDYGYLIRWEVVELGKRCAIVRNMATLKERVILVDTFESFTFQCELMETETGWGNLSYSQRGK